MVVTREMHQALRMRDNGVPIKEVAAEFEVNTATISRWCKVAKNSPEPKSPRMNIKFNHRTEIKDLIKAAKSRGFRPTGGEFSHEDEKRGFVYSIFNDYERWEAWFDMNGGAQLRTVWKREEKEFDVGDKPCGTCDIYPGDSRCTDCVHYTGK